MAKVKKAFSIRLREKVAKVEKSANALAKMLHRAGYDGAISGAGAFAASLPDDWKPKGTRAPAGPAFAEGAQVLLNTADLKERSAKEYAALFNGDSGKPMTVVGPAGTKMICTTASGIRVAIPSGHLVAA